MFMQKRYNVEDGVHHAAEEGVCGEMGRAGGNQAGCKLIDVSMQNTDEQWEC